MKKKTLIIISVIIVLVVLCVYTYIMRIQNYK